MSIYRVGHCYVTKGLFVGDSALIVRVILAVKITHWEDSCGLKWDYKYRIDIGEFRNEVQF